MPRVRTRTEQLTISFEMNYNNLDRLTQLLWKAAGYVRDLETNLSTIPGVRQVSVLPGPATHGRAAQEELADRISERLELAEAELEAENE